MCRKLKTAALLELTGTFDKDDNGLQYTFEYYWDISKRIGLKYKKFPVYDTKGDVALNLKYLDKLYKRGYRIFIGFSRSSVLTQVLPWFNAHPDAIGISATSTAYSLAVKKHIYRMTPIDAGIQIALENDILMNQDQVPIKIYFLYQKDDFFSTDYLKSFQDNAKIAPYLNVCTFTDKITTTQLDEYLQNSTTKDRIVNGLVDINLLDVFSTQSYSVNPYIYDNIGSSHPDFNQNQANNLSNKYSYFSYKGVNSSYLWRQGDDYSNKNNKIFSPLGLDILQVNQNLRKRKHPNYLAGNYGILDFDLITKDRKYFSVTREDFKNGDWNTSSLIFNDPIYGQFVSNTFSN